MNTISVEAECAGWSLVFKERVHHVALCSRHCKLICGLFFCLLLAGCAATPEQPLGPITVEERQRALLAIDIWTATGRIAVSSPSEGFSAAMDWQQSVADYDVSLTALLGQRALRVSQRADQASLQAPGRPAASGPDAESLLLQELGVRVPLTQMTNWIRGLPGTTGEPQYDKFGRLLKLAYTDPDNTRWVADFTRYQRKGDVELPALIDIKGGEYSIRLLIKQWRTDSSLSAPAKSPSTPSPSTPGRLQIPNA